MTIGPDLELSFAGLAGASKRHLSVDGLTPEGPNLSHWPGNRTPRRWQADLSTEICLAFARACSDEQAEFLGGATVVLNDHYDTDGFGSLLAVLRPEVALTRAEVCVEAAATGDYGAFSTERGFAIDRIVKNLVTVEGADLDPPEQALHCYRWLLANAERVLDQPQQFSELWQPELDALTAEREAADQNTEVETIPASALAVVRSPGPLSRILLNTLAGEHYRVLHIAESNDGPHYRYHDRTESWFELVSFTPPARHDLRPLAERLHTSDQQSDGRWNADPPNEPIPELYFGLPGTQAYGEITRTLKPSGLDPTEVVREVAAFLSG